MNATESPRRTWLLVIYVACAWTHITHAQPLRPIASNDELQRMQAYLNERNDPRIIEASIDLGNSEFVDCITATRQHGFDHPIVLEKPPEGLFNAVDKPTFDGPAEPAKQAYGSVTRTCPPNTIPRKHLTIEELSQFASLKEFHDKVGGRGRQFAPMVNGHRDYVVAMQNITATAANSILSINKPVDEHSEEFSLSQIWVSSAYGLANQETIEVGWQVARWRHNGSRDPYMFVYWSTDNYGNGCYDQDCPGFNMFPGAPYVPGVAFSNWSTVGGTQVYVSFQVHRTSTAWWIGVNGGGAIGYYLVSKFRTPGLASNFERMDFGGEVQPGMDYPTGTPPFRHSKIDMGSGMFSSGGWGQAAFHTAIRFGNVNASGTSISWNWAHLTQPPNSPTLPGCYDFTFADPPTNSAFYFGGGGYNGVTCILP